MYHESIDHFANFADGKVRLIDARKMTFLGMVVHGQKCGSKLLASLVKSTGSTLTSNYCTYSQILIV